MPTSDDAAGSTATAEPLPSFRRALVRGGLGAFTAQLVGLALSIATSIAFARVLGVEQYGAYAFSIATVALMVVVTTLGLPMLVSREVAAMPVRERWRALRGLVRWSSAMVLLASATLALVAAVLVGASVIGPAEAREALLVALISVPFLAGLQLAVGILRGVHQVTIGHALEGVARPAIGLALVVVLSRSTIDLSATWATGAQLAAAVPVAIVAALLARRELRALIPPTDGVETEPRAWIGAALPMMLIMTAGVVNQNIDVAMVGAIEGVDASGVYQVGTRGALLVAYVLMVGNSVLSPVVAKLLAGDERARLQRILTVAARVMVAVALPTTVVLVAFGRPLLGAVFGEDFEAGATALAILSIAQLLNVLAGSAGIVLIMGGRERLAAVALAIGVGANIGLDAVLIPIWGIDGAAIGTAISVVVWNAILLVQVLRHFGLDTTPLGLLGRHRTHDLPVG